MVSYWRWTLSAKSSKSRTIEGFSRDMEGLMPERTMAGHVRAMHSQYCRVARQIPQWFPKRQYKAPWRRVIKTDQTWSYSISHSCSISTEREKIFRFFSEFSHCKRCETYFKLLLGDVSAVWVQILQHRRDDVSAAEVVSSQCCEQHILSFTPHLR